MNAYRRWCLVILLAAFLVRMLHLGDRSLWFDEAFEVQTAQSDLAAMPTLIHVALQPPLYDYLLWPWLRLDHSVPWLRFLSVAFSLLSVAGMLHLGRRISGPIAGLSAAAMMALLPSEVRYAQEVGEYALAVCLLVWLIAILPPSPTPIRRSTWLAWGLLATLALYTHYGTFLVVLPIAALTALDLTLQKRWLDLRRLSLTSLAIAAAFVPLHHHYFADQLARQHAAVHWIPLKSWDLELQWFLIHMSDAILYLLMLHPNTLIPKPIGEALVTLLWLPILSLAIGGPTPPTRHLARAFLLVLLTYSLAVRAGWYAYGHYGFRYAVILAPLLLATTAAALATLWTQNRHVLAVLLLTAILTLGLAQISTGYRTWPEAREDLAPVVRCWQRLGGASEPTYVYQGAVPALRYYLQSDDLHPTQLQEGQVFPSQSPHVVLDSIRTSLSGLPTPLWLIWVHLLPGDDQAILRALEPTYRLTPTACHSADAAALRLERR